MMPAERVTTMEANGPPPREAAALYPGAVMHARLKPFGHRFVYRVFSLLIDLDRLDEAGRRSRLFGVNKPGIVSFHETDHTGPDGGSLRAFADGLFRDAGLSGRPERIRLLCYPRVFGYVFNPISVFFAYDRDERLTGLIYSVRNTFGERHLYVAPVERGEVSEAGIRQSRAKTLHVSPFIGMRARYDFRILPPGRAVRLRIHETEENDPVLAATFAGRKHPLDTAALAGCLLRIPFLTWKIIAAIHWEALKLWLKGARFRASPAPPALASHQSRAEACLPGE